MLRQKNSTLQQQGRQNRTHKVILFRMVAQSRQCGQMVRALRTQMTEQVQVQKIIHRRGFKARKGSLEIHIRRRFTGKITGGSLRLLMGIGVLKNRQRAGRLAIAGRGGHVNHFGHMGHVGHVGHGSYGNSL